MDGSSPVRRDQFKHSVSGIAGTRRRNLAVSLGKGRREALVRAKRIRRHEDGIDQGMDVAEEDESGWNEIVQEIKIATQELKLACQDVLKGASRRKLEALRKLKRLLSGSFPPLHAAVEAGAVPILVECLRFGSSEEQLLEAAWCLTNIASGDVEQTKAVMPAVPLLIAHLGEKSSITVVEQCAWALGNIAGDSEEMRDTLLAQGALRPLARLVFSTSLSLARTACWAFSNLIKGPSSKAVTDLLKLDGILGGLSKQLATGDEALVADAAWVLVYISSLSDATPLIEAGLLPQLISYLATSSLLVILTPVLRTIGNVVAGDNSKVDAVISAGENVPGGVAGALVRCLELEKRVLQKEAAWVISNIAAGSLQHKRLVFSTAASPLLHLLNTGAFDVKKEAAFALGNLCVAPREASNISQPIMEHLTGLVAAGCIPGFISLVRLPDAETSKLGVQFLELVLRAVPDGPKLVESCDGMEAIEMLQFHENAELRDMANHLMDTYYGDNYGLEEEYGTADLNHVANHVVDPDYPPWRRG